MTEVIQGRMTHEHSGELVVFLIGMRINKPWRLATWLPVFGAMPKMIAELYADPDSGFLGHRVVLGSGGPTVIQYWSSHEKLYAYASAQDATHRPAWTKFNGRARKVPGVVGIWHETFQVSRAESTYVAMPTTGLAKATKAVPVGSHRDRAAQRYAAGEVAAGEVAAGEVAAGEVAA